MDHLTALLERFLLTGIKGKTLYFEADELVELIHFFIEKEDKDSLYRLISIAEKLHPFDVSIKVALCKALVWMEAYEDALSHLESINLQNDPDADLIRLDCYCKLEKFDEAVRFLNELIESNCTYLEEAISDVVIQMNVTKKILEQAYHLIQQGLTLFPNSVTLNSSLCLNLYSRGYKKEALDKSLQLTKEHPFSSEIWFLAAELYCEFGDYNNAIDAIDFAISCSINHEGGHESTYYLTFMKAHYLYKNENYLMAIQTFNELPSHDEYDEGQINRFLAQCYEKIGDYETAYKLLKSATDQPDNDDEMDFQDINSDELARNFIYNILHHN